MTDLLKPKWCTYCRKDNHNDSECHSTRPANWQPGPGCPMPGSLKIDPTRSQKLAAAGFKRRPSWRCLPKDGDD